MKVELISHTPDALDLLLFTKQTRLEMTADGMAKVKAMSQTEKQEHLDYMRGTIQSSWEFVDYVFSIQGVTRAFTHQLVRHRIGTSFAQQSQRSVDMGGFDYVNPFPYEDDSINYPHNLFEGAMEDISKAYEKMLDRGVNIGDARGVLPTNIATNIIFKANLRTLHDMGLKRLCVKTQGEFQQVFREIRNRVVEVHPWAADFILVNCLWSGTCCFPNHPTDECPVKGFVYDPSTNGKSYGGGEPMTVEELREFDGMLDDVIEKEFKR